MPAGTKPDSWDQWGNHVLEELQRLNRNMETHQAEGAEFKVWVNREIATLKVKAGVWGVLGGGFALLLAILVERWGK